MKSYQSLFLRLKGALNGRFFNSLDRSAAFGAPRGDLRHQADHGVLKEIFLEAIRLWSVLCP